MADTTSCLKQVDEDGLKEFDESVKTVVHIAGASYRKFDSEIYLMVVHVVG